MKPDIHPKYNEIKVICSCGNEFQTKSTLEDELHIDVCSSCHPFYTVRRRLWILPVGSISSVANTG